MLKWILILCFSLSSCGIPDSSSFETLLAPFILDDRGTPGSPGGYPQCTLNSSQRLSIELKAMVFNTESSFSGYNAYIVTAFSGSANLRTTLTSIVSSHIHSISTSSNQFSTSVEDAYIVKTNGNLPTVPAGSPSINGYNIQPTNVIIKITQDAGSNYLLPVQYGFTLTAVSLPNVAESQVGNVIAIDGSHATTTPTYCGM